MNEIQHLLGHLSEEAHEVGKRAIKAQRFGVEERQVGQPFDNWDRICQEIDDFMVVLEALENLTGRRYVPDEVHRRNKREKMANYQALSRMQGQLDQRQLRIPLDNQGGETSE